MRALAMIAYFASPGFLTLGVSDLWADAECVRGYRDTTPEERRTMTAVLESALRALPPTPKGWVLVSDGTLYVQPNVCRDGEARPWSYQVSRDFQRVDDLDVRNKILDDAGAQDERRHAGEATADRRDYG